MAYIGRAVDGACVCAHVCTHDHTECLYTHDPTGNINQLFSGKSCTHTKKSARPWWRVNLGDSFAVERVIIYNRADCCGSRLNNVDVKVGSSVCGLIGRAKNVNSVYCGGRTGRTVTVVQRRSRYLTLCEVQVFGKVTSTRQGNKILARTPKV